MTVDINFIVGTEIPLPPDGSLWERQHFTGAYSQIDYPICKAGSSYDYSHWAQHFTLYNTSFLSGVAFRIKTDGLVTKPLKVAIGVMETDTLPASTFLAYGELPPTNGERYVSCIFSEPLPVLPPPDGNYYIMFFTDEEYQLEKHWTLPTQDNIPNVLYSYVDRLGQWKGQGVDSYYGKFKLIEQPTPTPPPIPCEDYVTPAECINAGCVWYNNGCHAPLPPASKLGGLEWLIFGVIAAGGILYYLTRRKK